jgi:hypothetical protein
MICIVSSTPGFYGTQIFFYRCFFPDLTEFKKQLLRKAKSINTTITKTSDTSHPSYWSSTLHIADFRLQGTASSPFSTEYLFLLIVLFLLMFCYKSRYFRICCTRIKSLRSIQCYAVLIKSII